TGSGKLDLTVLDITSEGIEYYLEAKDEVNTARWPSDGIWYRVVPPEDKPEQKFITPSNPEVVFGKDVEEVVIRDAKGNEIWRKNSTGGEIIIWRGEDRSSKKVELGPYIYQLKTKDGKKKYGVVIIVK
ncbi:MAG: hypothetical protein QME68_08285, partial [Elusimicrobiota bacterium]|nr:hypothetical protein [Elusimicrobiota bacterium]